MQVTSGEVEFDRVSFKYSAAARHNALSDITFHVASGQTVGIIGGTGSSEDEPCAAHLPPVRRDATAA